MTAGPLSGLILTGQSWVTGLVSKGEHQYESTRNLAKQLLEASSRIRFLEKTLADTQLELTTLRQQAKDTDRLRDLLGLKTKLSRTTIAAEIITRTPDNWFEEVTIDKGSLDHVMKGSAVITNKGVVGQIVSVAEKASVVRLVTDPDQKVGVLIERLGQPGILSGHRRAPAVIDYIPIGTSVENGDKIVCLGNGGIFPAGHPVGTVAGVRRDANGTTLSIEVKLSENFYDLSQVLVVPPEGI
jgi:rod shape-determining protein MreC